MIFIVAMVLATELIAARRRTEESLRQTQAKLAHATQTAAPIGVLSLSHSRDQPTSERNGCEWANLRALAFNQSPER